MVVQAFLIHRYSGFSGRAILVAVIWYGFNEVVDYFVPIVGTPHRTLLPLEPIVNGAIQHVSPAHEIAAIGAVAFTILATALATRIRWEKRSNRARTVSSSRGEQSTPYGEER